MFLGLVGWGMSRIARNFIFQSDFCIFGYTLGLTVALELIGVISTSNTEPRAILSIYQFGRSV